MQRNHEYILMQSMKKEKPRTRYLRGDNVYAKYLSLSRVKNGIAVEPRTIIYKGPILFTARPSLTCEPRDKVKMFLVFSFPCALEQENRNRKHDAKGDSCNET